MEKQVIEKVINIVQSVIANLPPKFNDIEADLVQMGMDSIVFVRIILELETIFAIEIPDEKLLITEMNSISKIAKVVISAVNPQSIQEL